MFLQNNELLDLRQLLNSNYFFSNLTIIIFIELFIKRFCHHNYYFTFSEA